MEEKDRLIGELVAEIRGLRRDLDALATEVVELREHVDVLRSRLTISTAWAAGLLFGIGAIVLGAKEAIRRLIDAIG